MKLSIPDHISTGCHVAHQPQACVSSGERVGSDVRDQVCHGLESDLGEEGSVPSGVEDCPNELYVLHWN